MPGHSGIQKGILCTLWHIGVNESYWTEELDVVVAPTYVSDLLDHLVDVKRVLHFQYKLIQRVFLLDIL